MGKVIVLIKNIIPENSTFYKILKKIYSTVRNLFGPYGYVRNYVWFPVAAFFRVHHIGNFYKKYEELEKIRDIHKGKRCFIIATGPSLQWDDLDKLKNEVTLSLNSLYKGYGKSDFRPNYYFIGDKDVLTDFDKTDVKLTDLAQKAVFLNDMIKRTAEKVIPIPINYLDHWFNYGNKDYNYYKNLKFSEDIFRGIYDKWTSIICLIEIAIYMGCSEIYLMGVDCNYSLKNLHFIKTDYDEADWAPNKNPDAAAVQQLSNIIGYEFINREAQKRGVKIYNASRGGSLEVFDRVDFDGMSFNDSTERKG